MKYFKIRAARTAKRYKITPFEFLEITKRKFPFEQVTEHWKLSQYGICPSCLNPIQLIGVVKEIDGTPYGKHTGKNIKGLPEWNQRKYQYCPFAVRNIRRAPNEDEWLTEIDEGVIELYNLLKEQFDRIVYIIEKELNFRGSNAFWVKVLNQYLINKDYLYPWLTEVNLPYIFAYFGMTHQKVYKQKFLIGSDIYNTLSSYQGVEFIISENRYAQLVNQKGSFLNLFFRFIKHTYKVSNGEAIIESMMFYIDDRTTGKTIYEKQIEFSETFFMNMINKDNSNKRQQRLMNIADKNMPALK